jgi:NAD(P)-dependent dehydrogenase (short-subunit alcohol dehydrogenase family)
LKDLNGKTAVITGAASGIGYAMAESLASEGMNIVLADISADALASAAQKLEANGANCVGVVTDVSSEEGVQSLAAEAQQHFGNIHVIANNAGVICKPNLTWEQPVSEWRRNMDVNLWGVINGIRTFVPHMLEHGEESHVVNIASLGGLIAEPYLSPYHVSKFGVIATSESLYYELAVTGANIGVTVVCPGFVSTNLLRQESSEFTDGGDDATSKVAAVFEEGVAGGISPESVAEVTLDAIKTGKLHVMTHSYSNDLLHVRFDAILTGENLPLTDKLKDAFEN